MGVLRWTAIGFVMIGELIASVAKWLFLLPALAVFGGDRVRIGNEIRRIAAWGERHNEAKRRRRESKAASNDEPRPADYSHAHRIRTSARHAGRWGFSAGNTIQRYGMGHPGGRSLGVDLRSGKDTQRNGD